MADPPPQSLGGTARAQSLTPERRKEIASKAAQARWSAPREPKPERPKMARLRIPADTLEALNVYCGERSYGQAITDLLKGAK